MAVAVSETRSSAWVISRDAWNGAVRIRRVVEEGNLDRNRHFLVGPIGLGRLRQFLKACCVEGEADGCQLTIKGPAG